MNIGDIIPTKKRRNIYIFLEEKNGIVKTKIPVLSKKKEKELRALGYFPYISISVGTEGHKPLENFIYANTLKTCKKKVRGFLKDKIQTLKKELTKYESIVL